MYVYTLCFIILKGIGDMTAKQAAVEKMAGDHFPNVLELGDEVTQFVLYNVGR